MSKLSKRHFWEWFKRHNQEYLELQNKSKKEANYWLRELNAHLRAYFKFFEFSIALPDKGIPRLTITVNGQVRHFKKVDKFVALAPEMAGWHFSALEDPMPIDFLMEKQIESAGIHPSEFSFSFASDDVDDTDVIIYHPMCTAQNEAVLLALAYAAAYNLLGERSFGLDIDRLHMANLSEAETADVHQEVHEMEELPLLISCRKPAMVIDDNGILKGM